MAYLAGAIYSSNGVKQQDYYSLQNGMLVHCKNAPSPPPQHFIKLPRQLAGTHLCFWVKRGTVKVKCFAQEHNPIPQPDFELKLLNQSPTLYSVGYSVAYKLLFN